MGAVIAVLQIHPADHARIKRACEALAGAIERRDAKTAEGLMSEAYRDERGLDRARVLRNLFLYLDAHGVAHVTPLSITVDDLVKDQAHATARVWLAQADPPPRGERNAVQLELSFKRENGTWRVTSAEDWELPVEDFEQPDSE